MLNNSNLRSDAFYKTLIDRDLFWVPANTLGYPKMSDEELYELVNLTPEEKQEKDLCLYDAIRLFQTSRFIDKEDIKLERYKNRLWEHHKSGYYAVQSNTGCCSSIAAWLSYILQYSYSKKGYLMFSRPDGSGHILNYILYDELYYIIDLSAMTYNMISKIPIEDGNKLQYIKSGIATSIFFQAKSLESFVHYHSKLQKTNGFDFQYFKIEDMPFIPPIYINRKSAKPEITFSFPVSPLNHSRQIKYAVNSDWTSAYTWADLP